MTIVQKVSSKVTNIINSAFVTFLYLPVFSKFYNVSYHLTPRPLTTDALRSQGSV